MNSFRGNFAHIQSISISTRNTPSNLNTLSNLSTPRKINHDYVLFSFFILYLC